jgi:hypothetical protein
MHGDMGWTNRRPSSAQSPKLSTMGAVRLSARSVSSRGTDSDRRHALILRVRRAAAQAGSTRAASGRRYLDTPASSGEERRE